MLIFITVSSRKGNDFCSRAVVETGRLIDHIGAEKNPMRLCTAVRNIGQWPKGWTSNLEEWRCILNKYSMIESYKILNRY